MALALTSSVPDTSRLHFTLGDLFRGLTICAVGSFAAVQYDPLVAIRAVGIGLALGLAFLAWRHRSRWRWLGAVATLLVGFGPTVFAAGVPFAHRDMTCSECGCSRVTHEIWGWQTRDEIRANDISRWAAPLLPQDHTHQWSTTSVHNRDRWFGSAPIGCGRLSEGVHLAWQLARLGQQQEAEALFREYCDIRRGQSPKSLRQFNQEASAAVDAAVRARNP